MLLFDRLALAWDEQAGGQFSEALVARHVSDGGSQRLKKVCLKIRTAKSNPCFKKNLKTKTQLPKPASDTIFPLLENITS